MLFIDVRHYLISKRDYINYVILQFSLTVFISIEEAKMYVYNLH